MRHGVNLVIYLQAVNYSPVLVDAVTARAISRLLPVTICRRLVKVLGFDARSVQHPEIVYFLRALVALHRRLRLLHYVPEVLKCPALVSVVFFGGGNSA